jgi:hypothetical protein
VTTESEERRRRAIELVIAIAIVAISLASLFTAVYQSIVMQRSLEASVWPRVEWENSNYDEERRVNAITFAISNHGVGPAVIARVAILLEGKRVGNENALLLNCCLDGATPAERFATLRKRTGQGELMTYTSTLDGVAVAPGQKRILFQFERPGADSPAIPVSDGLNKVRDELQLTVCYCSVFGDCWSARARGYKQATEPVRSCTVGLEPGFTG